MHSHAAVRRMKDGAPDNDLLERLRDDSKFAAIHDELGETLEAKRYVGLAPAQTLEFLRDRAQPVIESGEAREGETLQV